MNKKITINLFGASGHAKVIAEIIRAQGDAVGVMYDDAPHCDVLAGAPVLKASEAVVDGPLIVSIGSNRFRKMIAERYAVPFATAIHPTAIVSPSAIIGEGSAVMPGAVIEADAAIGRHCIINTCASVNHECRIGNFVHISPNATLCGNVTVGESSWIGAGATIIPGIKIGRWCTIGAGAVVLKDIPDGATAVGNPCKIIKQPYMINNQQLNRGVISYPSIVWLHNICDYAA